MRILGTGTAIVTRSSGDLTPASEAGGGWLRPMVNRRRRGLFVGPYQPTTTTPGSRQYYSTPDRFLTNDELWEVYRRTPDVRAAVDSIVRRVATFDWLVEPAVDPSSDQYEAAAEAAESARRFLSAPSKDGSTWQEVFTALLTDLLVYDAAALELVRNGRGELVEVNPLRGSSIDPKINEHGRVLYYEQSLYNAASGTGFQIDSDTDPGDPVMSSVRFDTDDLLFVRLFPTTISPVGNPLIEALITEVISLLRSSEHTMLALDADEIPPGILVLAGLAGQAAREATADLQRLRGQDHKVRVLTTPDPSGIGARWVELRHTPKDLSMVEVVDQIRRTVWRVFGVQPVEMGATDGVNRATAEVQVDVSSSHLVTPILELLAAKVNSRLLPLVVGDPDLAPLVKFSFDREARLSPEQARAVADRHSRYIDAGILTRNEARSELGLLPIAGGDVPTVATGAGPVPLSMLVPTEDDPGIDPDPEAGSVPPGDAEPDPEPDPEPEGGTSDGVEDAEAAEPDAEDSAPGEVDAEDSPLGRAAIDDVPNRIAKILRERAREHNADVGDVASKRTTPSVLAQVYDRGVGAYHGNPESVRPSVTSAEQWGLGRVDSFLFALRNGRFRRGDHDTDLLPEGHPKSSKGESDRASAIASFRAVVDLARLPLADQGESWGWESGESEKVLGDPPDWDRYARAHLWRDPSGADRRSGYKFPIARIVDGDLRIVFRGVASVIGALREDGKHESLARVSVDDQREIYRIAQRLYRRFGETPPVIDRLEDDRSLVVEVERAVGDVDPTNFPKRGDDLKVSLRNSGFGVFDPEWAERLRVEHPDVWGRGGNILGNKQYRRLRPVVARGGAVETETEEEAVRLREAWSARHFGDHRLPGVIAQIKWFTVGKLGESGMKKVVRDEIARLEDARSAPWIGFVDRGSCDSTCGAHRSSALATSPEVVERDLAIERAKMLPSEWLRGGLFDDVRTLDLEDLGSSVALYIEDVTERWRAYRAKVVAAVEFAARDLGDPEDRIARARSVLSESLEGLTVDWTSVTRPLYERAAQIGSGAALRFSGIDSTEEASAFASTYAAEQIGYLTTSDGLLADVRLRTLAALSVLGQAEARSEVEIPSPGSGAATGATAHAERAALAVALAEAAWDANEFRIASYAGRLVEVGNGTMVLGLSSAGSAVPGPPSDPETSAGPREATEWWAEWVATIDGRTCPVCSDEGSQPIRPLASISVRPGGSTPCGGRCRCVLVVWTEQEVRRGEALRVGPFD